jgi:hypothetical protein
VLNLSELASGICFPTPTADSPRGTCIVSNRFYFSFQASSSLHSSPSGLLLSYPPSKHAYRSHLARIASHRIAVAIPCFSPSSSDSLSCSCYSSVLLSILSRLSKRISRFPFMSPLDSHDPSPPGLANPRPATDVDQISLAHYHSSASASLAAPLDRRFSHILPVHSANSATSASSRYGMHMQHKEFNSPPAKLDGWSALSNRHTSSFSTPHLSSSNHPRSPPLLTPPAILPASSAYHNPPLDVEHRTAPLLPPSIHTPRDHQSIVPGTPSPPANPNSALLLSTLWWSDLEPWMDEEYAKQVCGLMGWDPVSIRVPNGPSDASGQPSNNPGYCFLTFPSPSVAASVLGQVNGNAGAPPVTMPNSNKPFVLSLASSIPSSITSALSTPGVVVSSAQQQYPKEYSIFVGDLAPETSNSDLVAVFRNPVLGLRNDREPKFIRPFLSCKSAKIMLDPVTGVSRGYGFVRWRKFLLL